MSPLGIILVILILVWLFGWGAPFAGFGYHYGTSSPLIHLLIVIVVIVVIVRLVRGERIF